MEKIIVEDPSGRKCEVCEPIEDEYQEGLFHCGYHCGGGCSGMCCYQPEFPYCSNMEEV